MNLVKKLYNYRELLKTNIKKEVRGRYKGSVLGVLWTFINPLLTTLVYAIVFPFLLRDSQPNYVVFIVVAIIPWTFFTNVINQGGQCVRNEANIIKKVYFPREILPISVVLSGLINFIISCIIIMAFLLIYGIGFSKYILWLPVLSIIQSIFSLGIIFITSSINVYLKDIEYIINFIVSMLFYGTPVIYNIDTFQNAPKFITTLINLNPLTHLINAYRDIFYYKQMFNMKGVLYVSIIGICLLFVGYFIFKKLEKGFAEQL